MSNFTERLTELMGKATKGDLRYDHMGTCSYTGKPYGDINPNFAESVYRDDFEYINFLVNHAPAIRDLVAAAEAVIARWDTPKWKDAEPTAHTINAMREARAKLEEA